MRIDFHSHTARSDGVLTAPQLLQRACENSVNWISITDHDTVAAYRDFVASDYASLKVIPGIEFSTQWRGIGVHVLGLNIDPFCESIAISTETQRLARETRAVKIAKRLERHGLPNLFDHVVEAAKDSIVGRPHFADAMVNLGLVKDHSQAFAKYLGTGKAGDVKDMWAALETVIAWIHSARGSAVLAHPIHYKLTRTKRRELIREFKQAGGDAIEVISGHQDPEVTATLARDANDFALAASLGSDFHAPSTRWPELGAVGPLPSSCTPVWTTWDLE